MRAPGVVDDFQVGRQAQSVIERGLDVDGVDAVMIGRGALRNPFIFEQSLALWRGETFLAPRTEDFLNLIAEMKILMHAMKDELGTSLLLWIPCHRGAHQH